MNLLPTRKIKKQDILTLIRFDLSTLYNQIQLSKNTKGTYE